MSSFLGVHIRHLMWPDPKGLRSLRGVEAAIVFFSERTVAAKSALLERENHVK